MLFGRQLGDSIDQSDPCTANPNDPICKLTAQDVANDPCKTNPNASYCQGAIVTQSANSPTPGVDTSQWSQFWDSTPSATIPAPVLAPVQAISPAAAASLAKLSIPWKPVLLLGAIIGGVVLYRRSKKKPVA